MVSDGNSNSYSLSALAILKSTLYMYIAHSNLPSILIKIKEWKGKKRQSSRKRARNGCECVGELYIYQFPPGKNCKL